MDIYFALIIPIIAGFIMIRFFKHEEYEKEGAIRTKWIVVEPPIFTQQREFLSSLIPQYEEDK